MDDHNKEKDTYGAMLNRDGWYWWDRDWCEHGPFDTEDAAERDRLTHPDFAVEPEIRNMFECGII